MDLCFSECGQYLYGRVDSSSGLTVLEIGSIIHVRHGNMNSTLQLPHASNIADSLEATGSLVVPRAYHDGHRSTTISSRRPVLSRTQDLELLSSLHQSHDRGAIVLAGHDNKGTLLNATLARLPASTTLRDSFSTLVRSTNQDEIRLVIDKAAQFTYSTSSKPDLLLPLVFDRHKDTVVVERRTLPYRLTSGQKCANEDDRDTDDTNKRICVL